MAPLEGIEVAVTRRGPEEGPGPAWIPEERVSLATMLAAYTIGSAYAAFNERETGSVEVGKSADLIVLDRNLFAVPPHEISETKVLLTLFAGHEVYRDPGMPATLSTISTTPSVPRPQ
jgi:predicted amidohydrolase YtcJ